MNAILQFTNCTFKKPQMKKQTPLLLTSFQLLVYHLQEGHCIDIVKYGSFWHSLFILWNAANETSIIQMKRSVISLLPTLSNYINSVNECELHVIVNAVWDSEKNPSTSLSPCAFISILFQQLFIHLLKQNTCSSELLFQVYRLLLHLLPHHVFKTVQPNCDSLLFMHQLRLDDGVCNHLQYLVHHWNCEYEKLIAIDEEWDEVNTELYVQRELLHKQIVSNPMWLLFLNRIDREKENPQCMKQFILLLSELLSQYGVSTVGEGCSLHT